ncbi:putative Transmembrane protein [Quillaja saponaria]|uniref:Transmembrane protein n=1 Tax=Quillaja saponaria TaxID=32244 RepID=A0AAD7Q2C8_QUISA|nr:putative Transmembrane protein [Quillaja saponaria]
MACPTNSIRYNTTLCACPPGHILNGTINGCTLFTDNSIISMDSGVEYTISFPETLAAFDSLKKFTQSQAVFLEATLVMLLSWLLLCFFLRFMALGDGRNIWFRIRWWISRLDICFSTRHWLEDQKVVMKRKTELGGTFSIASWILFIGLFAVLLYQIISKRTIEVHNVRASNGPELAAFFNDMEINITTVSTMSCANLRDLGTLVSGNSGFFDFRVAPLSNLANYSCHNTSKGPTLTLKCANCQLTQDNLYISWQFVDIPNNPATAVGFEFNVTAMNQARKKYVSLVGGTLKNGSIFDDRPVTFRGKETNILKFNLFPRIYHNLHDLRLIQPLFHEFLPGSFFRDPNQLQASLESSNDGLINTTLYVNLLSAYIVEIDNESIMGPVSFLADLGGLYCFSIGIFFYLLVQCEYRIEKLRNEDTILRRIRSQNKAQQHWDKLRKYVMYTWGCSTLNDDNKSPKMASGCSPFMIQSADGNDSSRKPRQQTSLDSVNFNRKVSTPVKKVSFLPFYAVKQSTDSGKQKQHSIHSAKQHYIGSCKDLSRPQHQESSLPDESFFPPPPSLEVNVDSQMDMSAIQRNLTNLYEYNVMLRDKLLAAQSLVHALSMKSSSQVTNSET